MDHPNPAAAQHSLRRLIASIETVRERLRSRRELESLDDRTLRDVGLTRAEVIAEIDRPLWH
jgi:uncharacterized protein YjiS (DUF1127 family)